ncbi:MAG: glycosyltransferase family 2 protein [Bacillaceae bacterium]|nr:glycosyltransferase family 2 protein [Bacillaceae bacterium]
MTNPLVSVIIPCYNYGEFIEEAIASSLHQTYPNIEVIVVDDCSTDPYTMNLLDNLAFPEVKLIYHKKNKGVSAARNTGIRAATGPYILALDADDLLSKHFLTLTVPLLEIYDKIGFVGTGVKHFGEKEWEYIPPAYSLRKLLYHNIYCVSSLFRKEAWKQVGGFNETLLDGYEDWDFWLSLAGGGWYGYSVQEILFYYRNHGPSKRQEARKNHHSIIAGIIQRHKFLYQKNR